MVSASSTVCCLNPSCLHPENAEGVKFCQSCGTAIVLLKNRYRPVKLLSDEGGFGRTYLAEDIHKFNKPCVIKQLNPKVSGSYALRKSKELFEQEAMRLQQLGEHSQIPQLLAYFEENEHLYLIQQYVPGTPLDKLSSQSVWTEKEVRDFLNDLLPVLSLIHSQNVIHRDIKPPNIMRRNTDGKFVLIDFGASKELAATVATKGTQIGTFGYAPMEQMQGGEAYPASDLFSLGVTCFYLLTGLDPNNLFLSSGYQWVDDWDSHLSQSLSPDFKQILNKLLQKDRQNRYSSASQVLQDLNSQQSSPSPAKSIPAKTEVSHSPKTFPYAIVGIVLVSSIFTGLMSYFVWQSFSGNANITDTGNESVAETTEPISTPANSPSPIVTSPPENPYTNLVLSQTLSSHSGDICIESCVIYSPDGTLLASGSYDSTINLWDTKTGALIRTLSGHGDKVASVAFSPDGKRLASGSVDDTIKIWDVATGRLITTLYGHSSDVYSVVFSPDGKHLASGSVDKTTKLWNVKTGNLLSTWFNHTNWVISLAFSPNSQFLASGSEDSTVKVLDISTGQVIQSFLSHRLAANAVAFSPSGQYLATASQDQTIKIWDVNNGNLVNNLQGHTGSIYSVAFSPDGKFLVSGSKDRTVKIWEVETGKQVNNLNGHSDTVRSVIFSPDGKALASGSSDNTIIIWRLP